jgi:2'-5' RNA ligase
VSGGTPPHRRLFFALWPDATEREALARAFGAAVAAAGGRSVPVENLHATVEFLGPVPDSELGRLAALGAALRLPDEALVLDQLAWWRRARVLAVAPSAPPAGWLAAHARLRAALRDGGFRVDARPWLPHVTLARDVVVQPVLTGAGTVEWRPAELVLVESAATPAGSRYLPLARWRRGAGHADFGML